MNWQQETGICQRNAGKPADSKSGTNDFSFE